MTELYMSDGIKAVRIDDLPPSAWNWFTPHIHTDTDDIEDKYSAVPWLWRGVHLRANAVASMPFAIVDSSGSEYDTSDDYQNKIGFLPDPGGLFWLIEAAAMLLGKAYVFREQNRVKPLGLRYMIPTSIEPVFAQQADPENGVEEGQLLGFIRRLPRSEMFLELDDLLYFWPPDPFTEIGPPKDDKCPGIAALNAAGVLYNVDEFAEAFFKRGAIKAMLLKFGGPLPPPAEQKRIKRWWQRVFEGITNAFSTEIVSSDTEVEQIGEGIAELSNSELTKEKREDIATALGIPMTILWSTEASGLGGGGVVSSDERKFYEQTIVPEGKFIAGVFNQQLLEPMGYRLVFRPETLDVFQADENERAQALSLYVNSGYRLGLASQILGIELPEGVDYDDLDEMREEDREKQAERMAQQGGGPFGGGTLQQQEREAQRKAMLADLRKWRTKARKAGGVVEFESEFIPDALAESINAHIKAAGVDEAFEFLKKKNQVGEWLDGGPSSSASSRY